jgi:hypothetical protein
MEMMYVILQLHIQYSLENNTTLDLPFTDGKKLDEK